MVLIMATITRTNAERIKNAFTTQSFAKVPLTYGGFLYMDAKAIDPFAILSVSGLEIQLWGVKGVTLSDYAVTIRSIGAPVDIPIRGA